jgi:putative transcriptional regulator
MIKHHPSHDLLVAYTQGELPAALAAGVAIHREMCPICKAEIAQLNELQAEKHLEQPGPEAIPLNMAAMIESITSSDAIDVPNTYQKKTLSVNNVSYQLPTALNNVAAGKWTSIGGIARSRLSLDDGDIRASLLQIMPNNSVPEHTHNGFELTLILDGSFHDEMGSYEVGDFIMLNQKHDHSPITDDGCLCYTVLNNSMHFHKGLNKLLNPIGKLIY